MAKTIKQLSNGLRIKYLMDYRKYFLFHGSARCLIDGGYSKNMFNSVEEAEAVGNKLIGDGSKRYVSKTTDQDTLKNTYL